MTLIETSQRLRRTQRKALRVQRRLWLAELALWPTVIVLAVLIAGVLWMTRRRRSARTQAPVA